MTQLLVKCIDSNKQSEVDEQNLYAHTHSAAVTLVQLRKCPAHETLFSISCNNSHVNFVISHALSACVVGAPEKEVPGFVPAKPTGQLRRPCRICFNIILHSVTHERIEIACALQ